MPARVLAATLTAAIVLGTPATAVNAQPPARTADITQRGLSPAAFPRIIPLAEHVFAYEQVDPTKGNVTVNNLIVVTPAGVVVCDGQGTVENTRRLVADIGTLTGQPITHVIVGSEHGDHTGGNSAFPPTATLTRRDGGNDLQRSTLQLGDIEVDVRFLGRAHTGRDLVVVLPKQRIVWASEVFLNRIFPSMANSYPTEWVATLQALEALDADIFVPAHGFVDSPEVLREELRNYRRAIERVISEGRRLHAAGVPVNAAAAHADLGEFRTWTRYQNNIAAALARVYQEIEGKLPTEPQSR
jgi:glyoxylase-like metal-dependent hydrolase (beta-lactamase superfamily II)